jgi:hypothetical protein
VSDNLLEESEPIFYRDNLWAKSQTEFTNTQRETLKGVIVPAVVSTLSDALSRLGLAVKSVGLSSQKP